jgi:coproporphyrinogen III oxidase-like Fe-S oxidoreductase
MLMLGMRLSRGVNDADFEAEVGVSLVDWLAGPGLDRLLQGGLLSWQEGNLAASAAGLQVLNAVLAKLLP